MAAAESHDGGFTYSSILGLFSDLEFYVAAGKVNAFFLNCSPWQNFSRLSLITAFSLSSSSPII